jgi:hypothetical protein
VLCPRRCQISSLPLFKPDILKSGILFDKMSSGSKETIGSIVKKLPDKISHNVLYYEDKLAMALESVVDSLQEITRELHLFCTSKHFYSRTMKIWGADLFDKEHN